MKSAILILTLLISNMAISQKYSSFKNVQFKNIYEVMDKWGSNHCSISYGHVGHLLISLASMLRIPVSMHNVEQERIFRPSYWNAFGENNSTAADFNACRALGPLYN